IRDFIAFDDAQPGRFCEHGSEYGDRSWRGVVPFKVPIRGVEGLPDSVQVGFAVRSPWRPGSRSLTEGRRCGKREEAYGSDPSNHRAPTPTSHRKDFRLLIAVDRSGESLRPQSAKEAYQAGPSFVTMSLGFVGCEPDSLAGLRWLSSRSLRSRQQPRLLLYRAHPTASPTSRASGKSSTQPRGTFRTTMPGWECHRGKALSRATRSRTRRGQRRRNKRTSTNA